MEGSPGGVKGVVLERMGILLSLAEKIARENPSRAKRYVSLARRLGTRFRMRVPKEWKARFCKKCNAFWVPGFNVKVRLSARDKRAVYACACGARKGFPYKGGMKKEGMPGWEATAFPSGSLPRSRA